MNAVVSPQRSHGGPLQQPPLPKNKTFNDFGGVNQRSNRQSIGDGEFYWLENIQPIGPGNAKIVPAVSATLQTIVSQNPINVFSGSVANIDYDFVVMASGHIYQVRKSSPYTATQMTAVVGALFSANTAIAVWDNTTVLIVDSAAGYWYWNGSSMTAISNTVASVTVTDPGVYSSGSPTVSFSGGGGSGASATAYMGIVSAKPNAAGSGYSVNDTLTLNSIGGITLSGNFATVKVTAVSGTGGVTSVTIQTAGEILNPASNTNVATLGGSGTGATIDVNFGVTLVSIGSVGSGYSSAPGVSFAGGTSTRTAAASASVSGSLNGNAIAVYAGRAWIANGRTVSFTDVDSFNSFGGAGGAFTINDETLHGNITGLVAANSFLYITGDSSFDILGDVQVSGGETSFTRQNVTASVGTTLPGSIFPFYRSLDFANPAGFYSLSGSTPQKISEALDGLIPFIDFTKPVTGGQVMVNDILCPCFCFTFTDVITGLGSPRPLIAAMSRDKWYFMNPGSQAKFITACPVSGVETAFVWNYDGANAYLTQLLGGTSTATALVITRLYDFGEPLFDKQLLRVAFGFNWNGQSNSGALIRIWADNEYQFATDLIANITSASMGTGYTYSFFPFSANIGGVTAGKCIGFTLLIAARPISLAFYAVEWIEGAVF